MSNNVAAEEQTGDNDYVENAPSDQVPVVKDGAAVEDPIDANTADSDEQLGMWPWEMSHFCYRMADALHQLVTTTRPLTSPTSSTAAVPAVPAPKAVTQNLAIQRFINWIPGRCSGELT